MARRGICERGLRFVSRSVAQRFGPPISLAPSFESRV
jgi:hypothetical protein